MSDDRLSIPEALRMAIDRHRAGHLLEAEHIYTQVLNVQPNEPNALHFLGLVYHQFGRDDEAIALLERSLAADPANAAAQQNYGNVLHTIGRAAEAEAAHRAAAAIRRAVEPAPELLPEQGYRVDLADTLIGLRKAGRTADAIAIVRTWLNHNPQHAGARHLLAALTGENVPLRAPDEHVREMFDDFADTFDDKLSSLDYRAPQLLEAAVQRQLADRPSSARQDWLALDAGCGTGLCGRWLKSIAGRVIAVDLSPKMIDKARLRGIYDELYAAELTDWLAASPAMFDLLVACDTIIYFGELRPIIAALAGRARTGGWLAWTVEQAGHPPPPAGFRLEPHGRYAHSPDYVSRTLAAHGFEVTQFEECVLRKELDEPVRGFVVVAQRR